LPLPGVLERPFVDALEADEERLAAALGHELHVLDALHRGERALADPVLVELGHALEELCRVLAVDHHVVVGEHDELAELPELSQDLVHGAEAHGRAVRRRDAAELARVRATAHGLHDLERDVLLGGEEIPARVRVTAEARERALVEPLHALGLEVGEELGP
jgi:hypothetical protein